MEGKKHLHPHITQSMVMEAKDGQRRPTRKEPPICVPSDSSEHFAEYEALMEGERAGVSEQKMSLQGPQKLCKTSR